MNGRRLQTKPHTHQVRHILCPRTAALFGFGLLSLALALSFSRPTVQADPIETDHFPSSRATVEMKTPLGPVTLTLSGPTTVEVDLGSLEANGKEHVDTEIVQMELRGVSPLLGPVTMRVPAAKHPGQPSVGEVEENNNIETGRLDLLADDPPFCVEHPSPPPNCVGTTADSFFDVYFEVEAAGMVLHNHVPKHMVETITHKPPAPYETYENPEWIPLYDESENLAIGFEVGPTSHTPLGPVGGIAELPNVSGSSLPYGAIAGGAAAAVALIAGTWYARRRWLT